MIKKGTHRNHEKFTYCRIKKICNPLFWQENQIKILDKEILKISDNPEIEVLWDGFNFF
jgi:hypothetical protein